MSVQSDRDELIRSRIICAAIGVVFGCYRLCLRGGGLLFFQRAIR